MSEKMGSLKIPKVYRNREIDVKELCMDEHEVNDTIKSVREQYSQETIILFLPF